MFEEWKQAWRQAVENFQRELSEGASGAAPRLRAMERELASASGALTNLDLEIRRTRSELDKEREAEQVCHRRAALARDAGDDETQRIAVEFAARHAERAALLQRKVGVLEDERALLARDVNSMQKLVDQAAATSRATVGATATDASPLTSDVDDPSFSRLERDARERAAEERLEELKRKMRS